MYEKKKKDDDGFSESKIGTSIVPKRDAYVTKAEIPSSKGNYVLRVEGLISQIQKQLDTVPAGYIPAKVVFESADVRVFGKQTYLFFMEKSANLRERIHLVDAVGLEELSRKVTDIYGKYRLVDILSQSINKRTQSKKIYLAIFVGE